MTPAELAKWAQIPGDRVSYWKGIYDRHGDGRSNLAYGYVAAR
jgi:hypothetical protein